MTRTLYLGIDPPLDVFHYPVIRTERIDSLNLQKALVLSDQCTHLIFTSKNGVRHWPGDLSGKKVIAIGEATACEVRSRNGNPFIAPVATQEGVIELIDMLDCAGAFFLYPHSKLSRSLLTEYMKEKRVDHYAFSLYDTVFQRPEPVPDLAQFDEVVFTSPSTVRAFFQIFPSVPRRISLTPIGPITKKALAEYFFREI